MSTPEGDLHAPLFTTTWDLCAWLLRKTQTQPHDVLAISLADIALRLLDAVTLALKDLDRETALAEADVLLIRLRLRLRLALETAFLNARQGQYALRPGRRRWAPARWLAEGADDALLVVEAPRSRARPAPPGMGLAHAIEAWHTPPQAGATSLEAGHPWWLLQQCAREPALREPGQRPARGPERQPRVPVCPRPAPTCRELTRHAAPAEGHRLSHLARLFQ